MDIIENSDQDVGKKDDFFDGDHESKPNGEIPTTDVTDSKEIEPDATTDSKDGGDGENVNDEPGVQKSDESVPDALQGEEKQDVEQPETTPVENGGAEANETQQENGEAAPDNGTNQDNADEGFQSTSPPPVTVENSEPEETEHKVEEQSVVDVEPESKKDPEPKQEVEASGDPTVGQNKDDETEDGAIQNDVAVEGQSAEDEGSDSKKEDQKEDTQPLATETTNKGDDYADSFSECSQISLASVNSTGKTMNAKIEDVDNTKPSDSGNDLLVVTSEGAAEQEESNQSQVVAHSPTPSDNRADAGSVVALVVEDNKTDGRSSVEVKENGEYRGEDMQDVSPPEGTQDSRGQGQWKSAEQQYFASAILAQKTEQEALKEVEEERDKLLEEQHNLKSSVGLLEDELCKKSDLLAAEREINCGKEKQIQQLQREHEDLLAKNAEGSEERSSVGLLEDELCKKSELLAAEREINCGKEKQIQQLQKEHKDLLAKNAEGSERRIKDLQERLAVLARENEEKDGHIKKLNEELRTTLGKLKETQQSLQRSEESKASNAEPPKSKTCAIM